MTHHTPNQLELPFDNTITIPLTQGQVTIIDAIDADLAELKWCAEYCPKYGDGGRYRAIRNTPRVNGKGSAELLHRVILSRMLGRPLLRGELVDHEDRNPLNNRRENLRLANHSQNHANQSKHDDNTSGFKGVTWSKDKRKWMARINFNKKASFLGYHDTPEAAHDAYCKAAREIHGEFARFE